MEVQDKDLDIVQLMREGIEATAPLRNRCVSDDRTRASAMGAVQVALERFYEGHTEAWERVREHLLTTRIDSSRLPQQLLSVEASRVMELHQAERPTLHLAVSTLNDEEVMTRTKIADWLGETLHTEERTVSMEPVDA